MFGHACGSKTLTDPISFAFPSKSSNTLVVSESKLVWFASNLRLVSFILWKSTPNMWPPPASTRNACYCCYFSITFFRTSNESSSWETNPENPSESQGFGRICSNPGPKLSVEAVPARPSSSASDDAKRGRHRAGHRGHGSHGGHGPESGDESGEDPSSPSIGWRGEETQTAATWSWSHWDEDLGGYFFTVETVEIGFSHEKYENHPSESTAEKRPVNPN